MGTVWRGLKPTLLCMCFWLGAPAQTPAPPAPTPVEQSKEIFQAVDRIMAELTRITGLQMHHKVPAALITRDKVKEFLLERMKETASPESIRIEELTLKKFGLVPQEFDLAKNTVDLLTEQAVAFYDFHKKKLFITDWTPSENREPVLAHELSHALADQNFHLERFIKQGRKSDDESMARMSVMEGLAAWLMAEYSARSLGASMAGSAGLVESMADRLESGAGQYPVFESEPLYLRRTLVWPYTKGMLFQNAVYQRMGKASFAEVFQHPPESTQQIMHADAYLGRKQPTHPIVPKPVDRHGLKQIAEGSVGELDHSILLEQFCGAVASKEQSPHWRGGGYGLWERRSPERVMLAYASEWDDAAAAAHYFKLYRRVLEQKWKHLKIASESDTLLTGSGDDGYFRLQLNGAIVTSLEGAENPIEAVR